MINKRQLVKVEQAEQLHTDRLFGEERGGKSSPVIPVITVITADHGTPVVGFVAPGTDPDLVSPFVANLERKRTGREVHHPGRLPEGLEA